MVSKEALPYPKEGRPIVLPGRVMCLPRTSFTAYFVFLSALLLNMHKLLESIDLTASPCNNSLDNEILRYHNDKRFELQQLRELR